MADFLLLETGDFLLLETGDNLVLDEQVIVTGTLAATEGADSASFSGSLTVTGSLSATEGADTASFTGTSTGVPEPIRVEVTWPGTTTRRRKKKKEPDWGLIREILRQREEAIEEWRREQEAQDQPAAIEPEVEVVLPAKISDDARNAIRGLLAQHNVVIRPRNAPKIKWGSDRFIIDQDDEEILLLVA